MAANFDQTYVYQLGTVQRLDGRRLTRVWSGAQLPTVNESGSSVLQPPWATLAVRRPGEIVVALRECWFNGVLVADVNGKADSTALLADSDRTALHGPTYPRRIAVGNDVWVMQGGFADGSANSPARVYPWSSYYGTVQRWSPDGALVGQHNYCVTSMGVDVAVDGGDLYVVTPWDVDRFAGPLPPKWRAYPSVGQYRAADAGDQQLALLDAERKEIVVLDRSGKVVLRRSYAMPLANIPVDIALSHGQIWLADAGAQALVGMPFVGSGVTRIELPDAPRAVADGPDGSLFVLGSRGWIDRYAPDGKRLAAWRLPIDAVMPPLRDALAPDTLDASDIAVGLDGRVYVPYTVVGAAADAPVITAGIWVFAPADGPGAGEPVPAVPPSRSACLAAPSKIARPDRISLGEAVTVTLRIEGRCPGVAEPHQVVFVVDTSGSMTYMALAQAKATVIALLESLNAGAGQAALVRFAENGVVAAPLTDGLADVRAAVLQLSSGGATHFVGGIDAAVRELTGPRGNPAARRTIVLVTDGIPDDDLRPAIDAARAAGLGLVALIYPTRTRQAALEPVLHALLGDAPLYFGLRADEAQRVVDDLRRWNEPPGLFERVEVVDEIPADMRLDATSIEPPAVVSGRTLTWTLDAVDAAQGVTLRYRLEPQAIGRRPTNIRAAADFRDVLGNAGRLVFPVPIVDVVERPTATRTATATATLPATDTATPTRTPRPTGTPSPTPRPVAIYLPIALREATVKHTRRTDIVLVIDASQSMAGAKLAAAKAAAGAFIDLLPVPENRIGLVTFNEAVVDALPPADDVGRIRQRIDGLAVGPGTRIDRALAVVAALLAAGSPSTEREPVVILLTDGRQTDDPASAPAEAARLRAVGVEIWAIGLGGDVDAAYLSGLTDAPGRVRLAPRPSDLGEVYAAIARVLPCSADDYWGRRCG